MAYNSQLINPEYRKATYEEAIAVQWSAVMKGTADFGVKLPTGSGVELEGIADDTYATTDKFDTNIIIGGFCPYISYEAITSRDYLAAGGSAGRLKTALPGEPFIGRAMRAETAAGAVGLMQVMNGWYTAEELYINATVTANTEITGVLLTGWKVTNMISYNSTANAVTITVGTAGSGEQIVASVAVGGTTQVDHTIVANHTSRSAAQSIHIDSANWNSSSLAVYIKAARVV